MANERRLRIPKAWYKIENWAEHDAALRRRGSLTVWVRLSLFGQPGVEFLDLPLGVAQLVNETDPHARPLLRLTDRLCITRSARHGATRSLTVVRTVLPRVTPFRPIRRIRRATEQHATSTPSRRNCRQTFRTP
ncbi:hypothetical protein GGE65_004609 [Skermanella aerolata]